MAYESRVGGPLHEGYIHIYILSGEENIDSETFFQLADSSRHTRGNIEQCEVTQETLQWYKHGVKYFTPWYKYKYINLSPGINLTFLTRWYDSVIVMHLVGVALLSNEANYFCRCFSLFR